jgi:hypothetical protein
MDFPDEDAACIWIIRNQFGRRNLAPFTRVELALKLEPLIAAKAKEKKKESGGAVPHKCAKPPIETREELAKTAGVSKRLIDEGKLIDKHADEETKQKLRTNQTTIHRVAKEIKETQAKASRQEKRLEAAKDAPTSDDRIIVGDFRKHADRIAEPLPQARRRPPAVALSPGRPRSVIASYALRHQARKWR